jgi:hypothetical protein
MGSIVHAYRRWSRRPPFGLARLWSAATKDKILADNEDVRAGRAVMTREFRYST